MKATTLAMTPGQASSTREHGRTIERICITHVVNSRVELNFDILQAAIKHVAASHGAFRHRFHCRNDRLIQVFSQDIDGAIYTAKEIWKPQSNLSETEFIRNLSLRARSSIDIQNGPLMTAILAELGTPAKQALVLSISHLISDFTSTEIILGDIASAYSRLIDESCLDIQQMKPSFTDVCRSLRKNKEAAKPPHLYPPTGDLRMADYGHIADARTFNVATFARTCRRRANVWPLDGLFACFCHGLGEIAGDRVLKVSNQESGRKFSDYGMDTHETVGYLSYRRSLDMQIGSSLPLHDLAQTASDQLSGTAVPWWGKHVERQHPLDFSYLNFFIVSRKNDDAIFSLANGSQYSLPTVLLESSAPIIVFATAADGKLAINCGWHRPTLSESEIRLVLDSFLEAVDDFQKPEIQ